MFLLPTYTFIFCVTLIADKVVAYNNCHAVFLRDHPYITSAKGLGGWGQEMAIIDDVQYCAYADIVGGWVRISPKIC